MLKANKKILTIGLIVLTAFVAAGCGTTHSPAPSQPAQQSQSQQSAQQPVPTPTQPQTASTDGKALYDSNCASCHGAAGVGGSASAVNDGKKAEDVVKVIKDGMEPVMPAYKGQLNDTQVQAIAIYVAGLKK